MFVRACFAVVALARAQHDTVPLPPLDTAWARLEPVQVSGPGPLTEIPVWVHVDSWGRVTETRFEDESLDEDTRWKAKLAAARLRFVPEGHPGWSVVRLPTVIGPPASVEPSGDLPSDTRRPDIVDRQRASDLALDYHPASLRRVGVGGQVTVWAFIDTVGMVKNVVVKGATGERALDEAAERVVWQLSFTPALNRGSPVPVWVVVPITFSGVEQRKPRPQRSFELGPPGYPIAQAELESSRSRFPEVIRPAVASRRLSETFLSAEPGVDLGLEVELKVGETGEVRAAKVKRGEPGEWSDSQAADSVVSVLRNLRFRPAMESDEPKSAKITAWLVFARHGGLIPSVTHDSCLAPPDMIDGPKFSRVDEAARRSRPTGSWSDSSQNTGRWRFQTHGSRFPFRLWYLIDETGRVCKTKFLKMPPDPYMTAKAQQLARRLRFTPAIRDGRTVAAWRQELLDLEF